MEAAAAIGISIFLILVLSFFILIKIAYYIKNLKINSSEKIIEKHIISGNQSYVKQEEVAESEEDKLKRVQDKVDLESKWEKDKVESNITGLGNEKIKDGSSSLDAIDMMRKMNNGNKKKSG